VLKDDLDTDPEPTSTYYEDDPDQDPDNIEHTTGFANVRQYDFFTFINDNPS
jgi:hypothetical protein